MRDEARGMSKKQFHSCLRTHASCLFKRSVRMKTGNRNKFPGVWLLTLRLGAAGAQVCRAQEGGEKREPTKKEEKTLDGTTPTLDVTKPVTDTTKGGSDVKTPVLDVKK